MATSDITNHPYWKKFYKGDFLLDSHKEVLNDVHYIMEYENYDRRQCIKFLATLCNYSSNKEEILRNLSIWLSKTTKDKRVRTLDNFILQFGDYEGQKRWNIYKNKLSEKSQSKASDPNFCKKLSDIQKKRYENPEEREKTRKASWRSIEYWTSKGFSEDEASIKISEKQSKIAKTKGKPRSKASVDWWTQRGYTKEEANEQRKDFMSGLSYRNVADCIKKLGSAIGIEKWYKILDKRTKTKLKQISLMDQSFGIRSVASKESLVYFIPLIQEIKTKFNIKDDDIYIGYDGKHEYYIASGQSYYYSYDFTIRSKKIIIEYNHVRWHPSKEFLSDDEWKNWQMPFMVNGTYLTADEKYHIDECKKNIAIEHGFSYYTIWNYKEIDNEYKNVVNFVEGVINGKVQR